MTNETTTQPKYTTAELGVLAVVREGISQRMPFSAFGGDERAAAAALVRRGVLREVSCDKVWLNVTLPGAIGASEGRRGPRAPFTSFASPRTARG